MERRQSCHEGADRKSVPLGTVGVSLSRTRFPASFSEWVAVITTFALAHRSQLGDHGKASQPPKCSQTVKTGVLHQGWLSRVHVFESAPFVGSVAGPHAWQDICSLL